MAATLQTALSGLARALVQQGRLKETEAETCAKEAQGNGTTFVLQVIQKGLLRPREIATFASETFGHPIVDIAAIDDAILPRDAIDRKLIRNHQIVALNKRGNRLAIALADPTNLRALDEIRFQTGLAVDPVVAEADKLAALANKLSESTETTLRDLTGDDLGDIDLSMEEVDTATAEASSTEVDDAPVVRFIQKVLVRRYQRGRLGHPLRALREVLPHPLSYRRHSARQTARERATLHPRALVNDASHGS